MLCMERLYDSYLMCIVAMYFAKGNGVHFIINLKQKKTAFLILFVLLVCEWENPKKPYHLSQKFIFSLQSADMMV